MNATDDDDDFTLTTDAPEYGLPPDSDPAPEPAAEPAPEPEVPTEPEPIAEPAPEPEVPTEPEPERTPKRDSPEELARKKVPYERFHEVVEKSRAREAELIAQLEAANARLGQQDSVDIDDGRITQLGDLLVEGRTEDFGKGLKSLLQEAVQTGVQLATERAQAATQVQSAQTEATRARQAAAAEVASEYAVFDPNSDAYDAGLTEEAIMLRDTYESRGFHPREAIVRAARIVADMYGVTPATAPAPVVPARASTVPRKLEAAAAQPPRAASAGELDRPVSLLDRIATMTDDEFDRLTDAQLEEIRRGRAR